MPTWDDFPPEAQAQLKAAGIDPSQLTPVSEGDSGQMSQGKAITSTLKAHAGGILGGGAGTLGTAALASWALGPEAGLPVTLAAIIGGLASSYGGQKAQQALLPADVEQQIEQEGQQAAEQHPWTSLGTDVVAGALASGGRPGIGSLGKMAAQAGINTGIDVGTSLATGQGLPSGRSIIGDVAGGALFSEPSFLGRMAHSGSLEGTQTEHLPEPSPEQAAINAPLKMAPQTPLGEQSPSSESKTGLQPKSQDTVTVNKQEDTTVTPNPIDKKTKEQNKTIFGSNVGQNSSQLKDGFYGTVQTVEGKGYPQVDEFRNGENVRSGVPDEDLQKMGLPTRDQIAQMPQGRHYLGDTPSESLSPEQEALAQKIAQTNEGWDQAPTDSNQDKFMNRVRELRTQGQQNAIQEPSPTEVLPRKQTETGETGSERGRVGPSNEGKETTGEDNKAGTEQTPPISGDKLPPVRKEPPTKEQPATDSEPEYHPYRAGTWAVADKVHDLPHPGGAPLADAAKQTLNENDRLNGRWKNSTVELGNELSAKDKAALTKVRDTELVKQAEQPQMVAQLSKKAQEFYRLMKRNLGESADYQIKENEPVYQGNLPRALKKVPWYWPGMANQQVEQVYRDNTDTAKIAKLDKTFDDWNQKSLGMTPQDSAKAISDFKKGVQGSKSSSEKAHLDAFNGSRKAMGRPLPPEFREPDIVKNMSRYFERKAIDLAHYKFIEKNPKAMAALGETKDAWGKPINFQYKEGSLAGNSQVRSLIQQFRPDIESEAEKTEGSLSRLITTGLIAAPTIESHKVVSNLVKATSLSDNPFQLNRALAYAVTHIKEGWQHAKEGGVVKLTANSSLDMFNGTMTAAQRMNGLAKGIRDISTLGGLTTKLNAGLLQSYFEYLVPSKIIRANNGDVTAQRFIRRLDPTYRPGKIYQSPEVQQLASTASQYVHGTSDIRTMPAWMMNDSELSGFLSLAHWSVAQTSNFQHDIWNPATRGDYKPLLTGVFGATVGGYLIKELREELSGKKGGIPSLSEIASSDRGISGNLGPLAYNAIAAMQYSGFGGLLSQVAKYPFDFVYKNIPQGATFPLDQIATDMVGTIKNVSSAIANDPNLNWVDLAKAVTGHILSTDMQLSRIALNQGINHGLISGLPAEKKLLADKMGQLRRFDMVEGLPYNDIDTSDNPYMNIEQQKFKHDQDVPEAAQMLPGMIQNIISRYGSNPDVMMSKIKALKENSESFFPSLESTPMQFFKYLNYLGRVEGPEAAQSALQDYMTRKVKNQVKSSIVP